MKDDPLPPTDHITRWCPGSYCDPEMGDIAPGAFMLKDKDIDSALSVNWLEYFENLDRDLQINEVRLVLSQKMKSIGATSKLAVLNVGEAIKVVKEVSEGKLISILHNPDSSLSQWDDPSHSSVFGLSLDDDEYAKALADSVIESYSARFR